MKPQSYKYYVLFVKKSVSTNGFRLGRWEFDSYDKAFTLYSRMNNVFQYYQHLSFGCIYHNGVERELSSKGPKGFKKVKVKLGGSN